MRKYLGASVIALALLFVTTTPVHAAALTQTQISAVISLLQAFNVDVNTIASVQAQLSGQSTPAATNSCAYFSGYSRKFVTLPLS